MPLLNKLIIMWIIKNIFCQQYIIKYNKIKYVIILIFTLILTLPQ